MVVTPTRPLLAAAALQRIGRPQEDPVLLLESALRAMQALMEERGPRMWRRCWIDQPYQREERELISSVLLPSLMRGLAELDQIDQLLICRQPFERSVQVESQRAQMLQGLLDGLGCGGVERGG